MEKSINSQLHTGNWILHLSLPTLILKMHKKNQEEIDKGLKFVKEYGR